MCMQQINTVVIVTDTFELKKRQCVNNASWIAVE